MTADVSSDDQREATVENEIKPMGDLIADSLEDYFREHGFDVTVKFGEEPA